MIAEQGTPAHDQVIAAADRAFAEIERLLENAHTARAAALAAWIEEEIARARGWAASAAKDDEDGEHALEMIHEIGTQVHYFAVQARKLREDYKQYIAQDFLKALNVKMID